MKTIINLENIVHSFGEESVIKEVDMSIDQGEIFGLLGPSGAGKTTLVKIIAGILNPDKGKVKIQGTLMPSLQKMRHIGFMAQSDALYLELSAKENLDFFASIYGLTKSERKRRVNEVLEIVDLTGDIDKPIGKFSGGMKRRLSLAAAILHEPEVLILDEPTVGIDPVLRQSIWKELNALKEKGTTIIVTTHVMDEADKCDRLALLRNGYVIAQGTPQGLKQKINVSTLEQAFLHYGGAVQ